MAVKHLSRTSICICVLVAAIALAAFAIWLSGGSTASSSYAVIHDGDGTETKLLLSENQTKTITTSLGTNVVAVENGEIYVSDADCPNHDCIKQGKISRNGQQIICLPHELWIEVVSQDGQGNGGDNNTEPDVTSR